MRNMKMLGLLAISALALVAFVGTSSASAAAKFTAANAGEALSETTITKHIFNVTGSEGECLNISFMGNTAGKEFTEQLVNPSYSECKFAGFNATIDINGCKYRFKAATSASEHATVGLEGCGSGTAEDRTKGIQITVKVPFVAECIVDVSEQSITNAVHYDNTTVAGKTRVDVTVTASGIMVDVTKSTGLCPLSTSLATHTGANGGSYTGKSEVSTLGGISWDAS